MLFRVVSFAIFQSYCLILRRGRVACIQNRWKTVVQIFTVKNRIINPQKSLLRIDKDFSDQSQNSKKMFAKNDGAYKQRKTKSIKVSMLQICKYFKRFFKISLPFYFSWISTIDEKFI